MEEEKSNLSKRLPNDYVQRHIEISIDSISHNESEKMKVLPVRSGTAMKMAHGNSLDMIN